MKPVFPVYEDHLESRQPPRTNLHPPHKDEVLQEQMRRLHNARARNRAARHPRAGRPPI